MNKLQRISQSNSLLKTKYNSCTLDELLYMAVFGGDVTPLTEALADRVKDLRDVEHELAVCQDQITDYQEELGNLQDSVRDYISRLDEGLSTENELDELRRSLEI